MYPNCKRWFKYANCPKWLFCHLCNIKYLNHWPCQCDVTNFPRKKIVKLVKHEDDKFNLAVITGRRTCGRGGSHLSPISTKGGRLRQPYTDVPTNFWKPQARLWFFLTASPVSRGLRNSFLVRVNIFYVICFKIQAILNSRHLQSYLTRIDAIMTNKESVWNSHCSWFWTRYFKFCNVM